MIPVENYEEKCRVLNNAQTKIKKCQQILGEDCDISFVAGSVETPIGLIYLNGTIEPNELKLIWDILK